MRWVAPTEKDTANETLEKRLWAKAVKDSSYRFTESAAPERGSDLANVIRQQNRAGGGGGPAGPFHSVGRMPQPRPGGGMAGD